MNKLHVESPKLSQDAAASWRPAPVTTNTAGGGEARRGGEMEKTERADKRKEKKVDYGGWGIDVMDRVGWEGENRLDKKKQRL